MNIKRLGLAALALIGAIGLAASFVSSASATNTFTISSLGVASNPDKFTISGTYDAVAGPGTNYTLDAIDYTFGAGSVVNGLDYSHASSDSLSTYAGADQLINPIDFNGDSTAISTGLTGLGQPTTDALNLFSENGKYYAIFQNTDGGGFPGVHQDQVSVDGSAVPEPATWAAMLLGFGGIGATMRSARRRQFASGAAGA